MSKNRFRQKPRGDVPADVHPGQQPPAQPSAIAEQNRQTQLDEERIAGNSTVKPQRLNESDAPLFTHKISPTQSPNDGGRRSGGPAGADNMQKKLTDEELNDQNLAHIPGQGPSPVSTRTSLTPRTSVAPGENDAGAAAFDASQPPIFKPQTNDGSPVSSGEAKIKDIPATGSRGA